MSRQLRGGWLVADRAFDSDAFRVSLAAQSVFPSIPAKQGRSRSYFPPDLYASRYTLENVNARPKRFRCIGTRYDKRSFTFLDIVLLAAIPRWAPEGTTLVIFAVSFSLDSPTSSLV